MLRPGTPLHRAVGWQGKINQKSFNEISPNIGSAGPACSERTERGLEVRHGHLALVVHAADGRPVGQQRLGLPALPAVGGREGGARTGRGQQS